MNNFDTLFPNFLNQCTEMNRVLTPIAFVLLAIGIVSSTVTGHRSPSAYLRTIGRTFAFAAVLAYLPTWNNEIASVVDTTVKQTLRADPAGVYAQYQKALAVSKGTSGTGNGSQSWWDLLDAQSIFEHLISAALWLLGFLASVIVFYAYLVQKFILYVGFALAPIFIGFLAVRTLHSIGVAFLLGYAGVLCWPIGWGAASILTSGLIGFMTDQSFLASGGFTGGAGYGLQNLLGLGALALWLISSTIAAPIIFKRLSHTALRSGKPCSRQLQRQESLDLLPASEQRQPSALRAVWPASLAVRPRQEPPHSSEQLKPLLAAALIRRLEILSVR
jgi:hypothetical protein